MLGRIFLGRYEALRQIGEGGMGRVYLGRQTDLGRQVVIKVMHDHIAADAEFRERFQRETLLMARFQHPYAVTLYDASLNDPQGSCIVMEYIRGITLDTLLHRNGRLTPARVGRLLGQFCEVLQAAHGAGIIHRDLKPSNLMVVDPDTPYEILKVMDFGLAKLASRQADSQSLLTGTEVCIGTPGYISPEQAHGEPVDHRADLYSVGIILYELLCGRRPFAGLSDLDMLLAHVTEEPPAFADVGAGDWVPPAIEEVVRACLAKKPQDRPPSARELAERYETALAHQQAVCEQELPPEDPRAPGRSKRTARAVDPNAVVHELQAWMPEKIAVFKLRGFVQDMGGEVLESQPGRIRVRLGGPRSVYRAPGQGPLSWLGLVRRGSEIDMELQLERCESGNEGLLHITVLMRPVHGQGGDLEWRDRCTQIYCDLRGYLMGQQ